MRTVRTSIVTFVATGLMAVTGCTGEAPTAPAPETTNTTPQATATWEPAITTETIKLVYLAAVRYLGITAALDYVPPITTIPCTTEESTDPQYMDALTAIMPANCIKEGVIAVPLDNMQRKLPWLGARIEGTMYMLARQFATFVLQYADDAASACAGGYLTAKAGAYVAEFKPKGLSSFLYYPDLPSTTAEYTNARRGLEFAARGDAIDACLS